MPLQDVLLAPGVNTQVTLAQNQAGVSVSNLVRWKEGLVQKLGGWTAFYPFQISTAPIRDVHAFMGLRNNTKFLGVGALDKLAIISCGILTDITPQTNVNNPTPSFTTTNGSCIVTVVDPGSSVSIYGAVRVDTPISVGGIILTGLYPIAGVGDANTYTINATMVASATVSSGGTLPIFYCAKNSAVIDVELPKNGFLSVVGLYYPFTAASSVGGITIQGPYQVTSILDSTHFQMGSPVATISSVSSGSAVTMNGGKAQLTYFLTLGPPQTGGGYGLGTYSSGAYGYGIPPGQGTGTKITATEWILDNWGEVLVATPRGGPLFTWAPDLGFADAQVVATGGAPPYNLGAFVSQPLQIMMAWGSCLSTGQQDVLIIKWSDIGAQQGYQQWNVTPASFAGSFKVPSGSTLVGGVQAPLYCVFWTDLDAWIAQYIGQPLVFSFTRIGTGCGLVGPHAMDVQSGVVYWMGPTNLYYLGANGVQVMPCPVWDFLFQQVDQTNWQKARCASNAAFNEISWHFPVIGGTGENQAYVKVHIEGNEYEWDYGFLSRTAWVDVTAVGLPIGTDINGFAYQHETSPDANGVAINSAIETGYFEIGDGSTLAFIDWILPDMKWATFGSATSGTVLFTFFVVDYPGQPERSYGPFGVTQSVPYISTRMRGRYVRMRIESQDIGSFWRVGRIKFRWGAAGAR